MRPLADLLVGLLAQANPFTLAEVHHCARRLMQYCAGAMMQQSP
jgi:hypothetical protein